MKNNQLGKKKEKFKEKIVEETQISNVSNYLIFRKQIRNRMDLMKVCL